jgi:uncharacterized protein
MSEAVPIAVATGSSVLCIRSARTLWERFRGLMGTPPLPPGEALWFPACSAIHTAFVRAAIDVLFLRGPLIVRVCPGVSPWRIVACREADSVVEMREGEADRLGLVPGGLLAIDGAGRTAERTA